MVSANTDAVMYTIEEEYKEQAHKVLHDWEKLTGLELEEDKIVKIIMRDVNNYAEIVQTGDNDYEVHYKGGELTRGEHKFKWNKDRKIFEYSFKDSLKSNSLSIISEAMLKKLLFDIPVEKTISECDDIFRFQMISHLGSTYEKCVQESNDGDIELQRNNRIYAGLKPSGTIVKVKPDGRRDSLANCPPNPIVDNANKLNIEDINKEWYIEIARQRVNDFLGIKRLEAYKKDELLELATKMNIDVDKKLKKVDLLEKIKRNKKLLTNMIEYDKIIKKGDNDMATKQELETELKETKDRLEKAMQQNENIIEKIKEKEEKKKVEGLYAKINEFRKLVRERNFIMDKELPTNLGGGEYASIEQFYNAVQDLALQVGLDFSFETVEVIDFKEACIKPATGLPLHLATVKTIATFTDIDNGDTKTYTNISQGTDTMDKAVSGASTLSFRQWFFKNFTPKRFNEEDMEEEPVEKSSEPKVPVYVPETKKEQIKKEVVAQVQQEESDNEDIKAICDNIMKVRQLTNDEEYGVKTINKLMSGKLSSAEILAIDLKVKNKLEKVGA